MFHSVAARRGMVNYMKVSELIEQQPDLLILCLLTRLYTFHPNRSRLVLCQGFTKIREWTRYHQWTTFLDCVIFCLLTHSSSFGTQRLDSFLWMGHVDYGHVVHQPQLAAGPDQDQ